RSSCPSPADETAVDRIAPRAKTFDQETHMPQPLEVRKVPIEHVSDASGLADLIDSGVMDADNVIAVIGKTEGNGGVNDYTRIIADRAFREVHAGKGTRATAHSAQIRT